MRLFSLLLSCKKFQSWLAICLKVVTRQKAPLSAWTLRSLAQAEVAFVLSFFPPCFYFLFFPLSIRKYPSPFLSLLFFLPLFFKISLISLSLTFSLHVYLPSFLGFFFISFSFHSFSLSTLLFPLSNFPSVQLFSLFLVPFFLLIRPSLFLLLF